MESNLLLILFLFTAFYYQTHGLLKVEIFYTYRCPSCRRFVIEQLKPPYAELLESMEVKLYPIGSDAGFDGNILHLCMFNATKLKHKLVDFVEYHFSKADQDPIKTAKKWASDNHVDSYDLEECYQNTDMSQELVDQSNYHANKFPFITVPTIIYNSTYDEDLQTSFRTKFKETICDMIENPPKICTK